MEHEWDFAGGKAVVSDDEGSGADWHLSEGEADEVAVMEVFAREILRLRQDNDALRMTAEESREVAGELLGALAAGEVLRPCFVEGCHGHLQGKAKERFEATLKEAKAVLEAASHLAREVLTSLRDGTGIPEHHMRDIAEECGLVTVEDYDPAKHGDDTPESELAWVLTPLAKQLLGEEVAGAD